MKKEIVMVIIACFAAAQQVAAQEMRLDESTQLDAIEVTHTQSRIAAKNLHLIHMISRDEIARIPAESLTELLENLPGIDVRVRGEGVQADISMRGGTFDQMVILLNGVNISDSQTGHYSLDLPIDVSMINRIEVLKGTAMNIFGLGAFAGAINIITSDKDEQRTTASIAAGDYGFIKATLGANYNIEKWTISGAANYNQSSGYTDHTEYMRSEVFAQATCHDSITGEWDIQIGGQLKNYAANSFYSLAYPDQYEATRTLIGSLTYKKAIKQFDISAQIYHRTHYDRFELIHDMSTAPAWYTGHNHHLNFLTGGNIKGQYHSFLGTTSVGIELRDERIISNVLGEELATPRPVPTLPDSVQFKYHKERLNINYFVEQSFYVNNFNASIGMSGNWNNMFAHNFAFSANAGYAFATKGNIYASIARSLRLPTFTDLYYHSATQESNPELKPENSYNFEIGVNYSYKGFSVHGAGYYRIGHNIIDWIKQPQEEVWHCMNHSKIDAAGMEISASYHFGYWLKKAEVSYSFCDINKKADDYMSKYALDYLRHKLTFSIHHAIYRKFGASWELSFQQRNGEYTNKNGLNERYTPIWLLNGRIYWENKNLNLYVEAQNITNSRYYDFGGIEQPGIWVKGGIKIQI